MFENTTDITMGNQQRSVLNFNIFLDFSRSILYSSINVQRLSREGVGYSIPETGDKV